MVPARKLSVVIGLGTVVAAGAFAADWDFREFADCIAESGAKYYGTHWCPYCARQNRMFGSDWRYLPYVECSPPNSRETLPRCDHVDGYPTWIFADGRRLSGVLSVDTLSARTGCELRQKDYFVD